MNLVQCRQRVRSVCKSRMGNFKNGELQLVRILTGRAGDTKAEDLASPKLEPKSAVR
jgi:hypothetical protein